MMFAPRNATYASVWVICPEGFVHKAACYDAALMECSREVHKPYFYLCARCTLRVVFVLGARIAAGRRFPSHKIHPHTMKPAMNAFSHCVSAGSLCCYLLNEIRYSAPKSSRPPSRRNNFRIVSAREGRVHLAGKCDVVERERGIPHLVNGQIDALRCVCSQREGANQTSVTSPKILCCSFNVLNGWKWKECTFGMRKLGKTTECYQSCIAFNLFEQNGNFIAENHFLHCLLFRK